MKKAIIFIVLAACAAGCLQAQDTVWMKPAPMNNYFNNNWIDTTAGLYNGFELGFGVSRAIARQFITGDTLQVYGIAAMMVNMYFGHPNWYSPAILQHDYPEDPTFDNLKESLLLYQYNGNYMPELMQQLGDSLPVHYLQTPVSYYIMSNRQPVCSMDTFAKPVYERYFSTPQTVHDTFFAGFTTSHWGFDEKDSVFYEKRPSFYCMAFDHTLEALWVAYDEEIAALLEDTAHIWWYFRRHYVHGAYFIFPILTPDPNIDTTITDTTTVGGGVVVQGDSVIVCDTLIVGGDTIVTHDTLSIHDFVVGTDSVLVGDTLVVTDTIVIGGDTIVVSDTLLSVMQPDLLQRLTGVMPSPARDRARVVSSIGLTDVEVYSLTGRRVHTLHLPAAQLSATIDVSRWPAGTYLLRITTPMGATMKKLTVTR